jgi:succinate dehydrogenase hydrophobic anchor subunit
MIKDLKNTKFEASIISRLETLPFISIYAKTRGWYFLISWFHRITGILLVIFVWFHVYFLDSFSTLGTYLGNTQAVRTSIMALLGWILSIPIIFHAFNGGRLILYESFGKRNDESMIRWVFTLSVLYVALLGLFLLMGDQSVSPFLYWLMMSVTALIMAYSIAARIWKTEHSVFWKLQRTSGAFLLVTVPAYILFIHLSPSSGKVPQMVMGTVQIFFIRIIHLAMLVGALYHGGYGIWSVVSDYISSRILKSGLTILITLVTLIFTWFGIKLIIGV